MICTPRTRAAFYDATGTTTRAVLAALAKAMRARRTCTTCRHERPYCIPRSLGECIDCALDPSRPIGVAA